MAPGLRRRSRWSAGFCRRPDGWGRRRRVRWSRRGCVYRGAHNVARMQRVGDSVACMQQVVRDLATPPAGLTASELARRAGVNRSTLHRISVGAVEPSLDTLHELAIVHGLELEVRLSPLSDPDAALAARHLFDPAFE